MMARIYSGLQTNNEHPLPDDYETHFLHCVDYLRQAIMCAADVALEPHTPNDPDDLGPLDGSWGGHHGEFLGPLRWALVADGRVKCVRIMARLRGILRVSLINRMRFGQR